MELLHEMRGLIHVLKDLFAIDQVKGLPGRIQIGEPAVANVNAQLFRAEFGQPGFRLDTGRLHTEFLCKWQNQADGASGVEKTPWRAAMSFAVNLIQAGKNLAGCGQPRRLVVQVIVHPVPFEGLLLLVLGGKQAVVAAIPAPEHGNRSVAIGYFNPLQRLTLRFTADPATRWTGYLCLHEFNRLPFDAINYLKAAKEIMISKTGCSAPATN
jgi:hypothetical protein